MQKTDKIFNHQVKLFTVRKRQARFHSRQALEEASSPASFLDKAKTKLQAKKKGVRAANLERLKEHRPVQRQPRSRPDENRADRGPHLRGLY